MRNWHATIILISVKEYVLLNKYIKSQLQDQPDNLLIRPLNHASFCIYDLAYMACNSKQIFRLMCISTGESEKEN